MAYGKPAAKKQTSVRLTGLFKTKKPGLYVGSTRAEDLSALIEKIKEAKSKGVGLTFFLWKNEPGKGPLYSLNTDLEQPREQRTARPARRPIEPDDDDAVESDDSLFGDE